mmetsp:Transcript_14379/g.45907  ORF Transcript_14379/g.45907 Transcript_14379/m.45907 type:complete len:306 (-) Transcript_14379:262-1179(-)
MAQIVLPVANLNPVLRDGVHQLPKLLLQPQHLAPLPVPLPRVPAQHVRALADEGVVRGEVARAEGGEREARAELLVGSLPRLHLVRLGVGLGHQRLHQRPVLCRGVRVGRELVGPQRSVVAVRRQGHHACDLWSVFVGLHRLDGHLLLPGRAQVPHQHRRRLRRGHCPRAQLVAVVAPEAVHGACRGRHEREVAPGDHLDHRSNNSEHRGRLLADLKVPVPELPELVAAPREQVPRGLVSNSAKMRLAARNVQHRALEEHGQAHGRPWVVVFVLLGIIVLSERYTGILCCFSTRMRQVGVLRVRQ